GLLKLLTRHPLEASMNQDRVAFHHGRRQMHFPEAAASPSQISNLKWDNGDGWDAWDKLFLPCNQRVTSADFPLRRPVPKGHRATLRKKYQPAAGTERQDSGGDN